MDDPRSELIRGKNRAFTALTVALAACERRRHVHAQIPASWLERLEERRAAYRLARLAWRSGRARWTG